QKIIPQNSFRPCLKYHMGYCLAPCAGKITNEEYRRVLIQLVDFLEGKHGNVIRSLKKKMEEASETLQFEQAARFRDQLKAVENVIEGQSIAARVKGEQDAIAFAAG